MAKPMNKVLRFILLSAVILAGVAIVGMAVVALYIHVKYPPAKLKALATDKLTETIHHKVSIGDIQFNMMTGFKITNLKIENRAGWMDTPFVAAKDISISYHLYELIFGFLSGQVSLGEIRLDSPQILVERRGLDQFNFSDMMGDAAPAPASTAPARVPAKPAVKGKKKPKAKPKHKKHAALPVPQEVPATSSWFADSAWADTTAKSALSSDKGSVMVSVDSVAINHGVMTYIDETTSPAQRSDLKDLNLKVKNISLTGGKTTFTLSTPFTLARMEYKLDVNGALRYYLDSQSLRDIDVKGTVNGLGFGFSGNILNLTTNFSPDIDGESSLNMLQFSGLIPKSLGSMPDGLSMTGPAEVKFHLDGNIKSGLQIKGKADGTELAIKYKDLFVKTSKSVCKVDFKSVRSANGSFVVPNFDVLYQDWEVSGSFHYPNVGPWSCDVHSKSLPFKGLPGMLPKLKSTTIEGGGSLDLAISPGKVKGIPINVSGKVTLKGVGVSLPQESYFQNMNGPINITDNVARIPSATFQAFDGSNALGVTLNGNTSVLNFAFNLKNVTGIKAWNSSMDAFVEKNPQSYKNMLDGTLNLVFKGVCKGFSPKEIEGSLAGAGTFSIENAKIKGISMIKLINGLFHDPSDELKTELIDGDFSIKNQVVTYNAKSSDKVANNRIHGAINFDANYAPEMRIQSDIKKEYADLGKIQSLAPGVDLSCAYNPDGTFPFDLRLTGSASKTPGFDSWDRERLLKNVGDCMGKKAGDAIQEKGQQLLKGLFGK